MPWTVLPEQGQDVGLHQQVGDGKFHVVRVAVRGDVLKQQLPPVGIFAFVPFKRNVRKPYMDSQDKQDDDA